MTTFFNNPAFSRVTALAEQRPVHAAFAWLHGNPKTIMDWQAELTAIPAPPFGEQARAEWLTNRFAEIGLQKVETDEAGNVFGWLPAANLPPENSGPLVVISAHLDTVFPADTPLQPVVDGDRLTAPGACDNPAVNQPIPSRYQTVQARALVAKIPVRRPSPLAVVLRAHNHVHAAVDRPVHLLAQTYSP